MKCVGHNIDGNGSRTDRLSFWYMRPVWFYVALHSLILRGPLMLLAVTRFDSCMCVCVGDTNPCDAIHIWAIDDICQYISKNHKYRGVGYSSIHNATPIPFPYKWDRMAIKYFVFVYQTACNKNGNVQRSTYHNMLCVDAELSVCTNLLSRHLSFWIAIRRACCSTWLVTSAMRIRLLWTIVQTMHLVWIHFVCVVVCMKWLRMVLYLIVWVSPFLVLSVSQCTQSGKKAESRKDKFHPPQYTLSYWPLTDTNGKNTVIFSLVFCVFRTLRFALSFYNFVAFVFLLFVGACMFYCVRHGRQTTNA